MYSVSSRGKSVKRNVIKILFKINNAQLSPSQRYRRKFHSLKEGVGSLWAPVLTLSTQGRLLPLDHRYASCKHMSKKPSSCPCCSNVPFLRNDLPHEIFSVLTKFINFCVRKISLQALNSLPYEFSKRVTQKWFQYGVPGHPELYSLLSHHRNKENLVRYDSLL